MSLTVRAISQTAGHRRVIAGLYLFYLVLLVYTVMHHELWGDELHSWNIAKGSGSFFELLRNIRYEGHPPLWYAMIWLVSKFTHDLFYVQCLQILLISATVYLLLFRSPLPVFAKMILPFGYYFLYEYGALSRNYAVGVLLACCVCLLLQRKRVKDGVVYYLLLFLLANTHLLGVLLAVSLHFYFLLQPLRARKRIAACCFGFISIFPALFFIFPPGDSQLNIDFWLRIWNAQRLADIAAAPVKALAPLPAIRETHFWNTHFTDHLSWPLTVFCAVVLTAAAVAVLRKDKRSLFLFLLNLLLTFAVALLFPLNTARYTGFIFISFIMAAWLYSAHYDFPKKALLALNGLLILQLPGSFIALPRDWARPFSNAYRVNEILKSVPSADSVVSSYWCFNNVAAYADKPFYCLELNKRIFFLLWDKQMSAVSGAPHVFTRSFRRLFQEMPVNHVWLLSSYSPEALHKKDDSLYRKYNLDLKRSVEGAIETQSDLYLYQVSFK